MLALAVRLAWGLSQPVDAASIEQLPDQREYLELADNLLHGRGLHFYDPRFGQEVYAYRTPGYPAFLAALGASPRAARVAQAFLDVSTVLAAYLLARRWLAKGPSLFAAAITAFNPFLIYFTGLLLSETLFTALLTWGIFLSTGIGRTEDSGLRTEMNPLSPQSSALSPPSPALSPFSSLLGGVLLAVCVLVRPSGIGLPILIGTGAAIMNRSRAGAYPRWWPLPPATTMLLLTLAALAPWGYRNNKLLGHWIWTTTNAGITAYDGFNDDATGASDQRFTTRTPGIGRADEVQRNDYFAERASIWVSRHHGQVAELAVKKVLRTWSPVPLSEEYGKPLYRWIGGMYALPLDGLVILGLFYGGLPRGAKVFLLLPAIYITVIHAMSVGSLRYRLPAEPMLAIIACSVLARSVEFSRRKMWKTSDGV